MMTNNSRLIRPLLLAAFLAALLFVVSCQTFTAAPLPTQPPGMVETIVAATYEAIEAKTPLPTATETPLPTPSPTRTSPPPTATYTPTPTFIFALATATPFPTLTPIPTTYNSGGSSGGSYSSGDSRYSCHFVSQTPENGTKMNSRRDFDWNVTITNTGTKTWGTSMQYTYVRGDKFHRYREYNIPTEVPNGETITLTIDMEAPKEPGNYLTTWALKNDNVTFCYFSLQVIVTNP